MQWIMSPCKLPRVLELSKVEQLSQLSGAIERLERILIVEETLRLVRGS